jgi:hypothetical protein
MWKIATGIVFWVAAAAVNAAAPAAAQAVCADCTPAVVVADAKGVAPKAQTPAAATAPAEDARTAAGLPEGYALMLAAVVALIFMAGRRRRD